MKWLEKLLTFRKDALKEISKENISKLSVISVVFGIIEALVVVVLSRKPITVVPNAVFVLFSTLMIPLILREKKLGRYNWKTDLVVTAYGMGALILGVALTVVKIDKLNSIYVYIMVLYAVAATIYMTPTKMTFMFGTSFTLFTVLTSKLIDNEDTFLLTTINNIVMHIIAWVLGLVIFRTKYAHFLDKQELIHKNELLKSLSITDMMTGLYNHEFSFTQIKEGICNIVADTNKLTIAMIDIDNFKLINDTYGHTAGDEVLKDFASILKKEVRELDVVGRYGGEEFIIIFRNTLKANVESIIKRIREEVKGCEFTQGIKLTFSCGISEYDGGTAENLVKSADAKLYYVKNHGKDNFISEFPNQEYIKDINDKEPISCNVGG